jgi:hypothetical protein
MDVAPPFRGDSPSVWHHRMMRASLPCVLAFVALPAAYDLMLASACAAVAPHKTWEDFGVDSSIVTSIDSIDDESAILLVRAVAPSARSPTFIERGRDSAGAWFHLDPSRRGRNTAFARFERPNGVWSVSSITLAVDRVLLADDVDATVARRLIEWSAHEIDAPGALTRVGSGPSESLELTFSYDGRQRDADGCICSSFMTVRILDDDTIVGSEMVDGGCILFGPTD